MDFLVSAEANTPNDYIIYDNYILSKVGSNIYGLWHVLNWFLYKDYFYFTIIFVPPKWHKIKRT